MLIIVLSIPGRSTINLEWHISEPVPEGVHKNLNHLEYISVDGDELDHIKTKFTNLPMANHKRVVSWRGELARFIVENL